MNNLNNQRIKSKFQMSEAGSAGMSSGQMGQGPGQSPNQRPGQKPGVASPERGQRFDKEIAEDPSQEEGDLMGDEGRTLFAKNTEKSSSTSSDSSLHKKNGEQLNKETRSK